jgi:hypothetical protein
MSCWLITGDGTRVRVGRGGLVIGRRSDCGLVLADPGVSRRHALVRETIGGAEIVHLGRSSTKVDGDEVRDVSPLRDGSLVEIGQRALSVALTAEERDVQDSRAWVLEGPGTALYGINRTPFVVGSAPEDDLVLRAWPASAARFHAVQDSLVVEMLAPGSVRGGPVTAQEFVGLRVGDEVRFGELGLSVLSVGVGTEGTTRLTTGWAPPTEVSLHFHARGGLLTLTFPAGKVSVHLPDRRCDLIATLLRPPGGKPGDFVADPTLAPRVWPGKHGKGRTDINLLLLRTRRSLLEDGIDGPALLERGPGGGETRIRLARNPVVTIS